MKEERKEWGQAKSGGKLTEKGMAHWQRGHLRCADC